MSSGNIVQVIGAVVDVEFPQDQLPKVYDALRIEDRDLTLEVQQQLGDGVVRAIAMVDEPVFPNLIGYIERGEIRPVVAKTFPLIEIVAAQQEFLRKAHVGKFVLIP